MTLARSVGGGVAHADADSDYKQPPGRTFIAHARTSESQWEASAIKAAHDICGLAASGQTPDGIRRNMPPKTLIMSTTMNATIDDGRHNVLFRNTGSTPSTTAENTRHAAWVAYHIPVFAI